MLKNGLLNAQRLTPNTLMPRTKSENLCLLVTMLESQSPLSWGSVERLLADFHGWLRFAENLREAPRNSMGYRYGGIPLNTSGMVEPSQREALLALLAPYAALLDNQTTIAQKIEQITQYIGTKQDDFWNAAVNNQDEEVRTQAEWVLDKTQGRGTLLRASEQPDNAPDELLRAAHATPDDGDNLLLPSDVSQSEPSKPAGFWARLLGRHQT